MAKRLVSIIITLFAMCSVFGQDTLFVSMPDTLIVEKIDTIVAPSSVPIDYTPAYLSSWRKAFPFHQLSWGAYESAIADTLLNKRVRPFRYSRSKESSDSIKAQIRCIPFNPKLYVGMTDFRLPIFVTGEIPQDKQPAFLDQANDFSHEKWDYVEPADQHYRRLELARNIREVQAFKYVKANPSRFSYTRGAIELPPSLNREEVSTEKSLEGKNLNLGTGIKTYTQIGGIQSQIKTDLWHHAGSSLVQMSQTALSDNWYKGGDNNMTVSTVQKLALTTYDENKKTSFDIMLELRLSSLYAKADTVNPMRVNDNLFTVNVKYGYQAWKRWYYSSSLYAKTPVFDYHNANSRVTKSTFFAPLETNVSVGMEYKFQSKNKNVNYTLLLAPVAYNMKYVATERVDASSFGIKDGKKALHKYGATVSTSLAWKISKDISWNSRLYYFTSYDNIQVEFENTFNINVGRRFTCQLYLYPRFDDSFDEKIQMKEMLTFGINYVW